MVREARPVELPVRGHHVHERGAGLAHGPEARDLLARRLALDRIAAQPLLSSANVLSR